MGKLIDLIESSKKNKKKDMRVSIALHAHEYFESILGSNPIMREVSELMHIDNDQLFEAGIYLISEGFSVEYAQRIPVSTRQIGRRSYELAGL